MSSQFEQEQTDYKLGLAVECMDAAMALLDTLANDGHLNDEFWPRYQELVKMQSGVHEIRL